MSFPDLKTEWISARPASNGAGARVAARAGSTVSTRSFRDKDTAIVSKIALTMCSNITSVEMRILRSKAINKLRFYHPVPLPLFFTYWHCFPVYHILIRSKAC